MVTARENEVITFHTDGVWTPEDLASLGLAVSKLYNPKLAMHLWYRDSEKFRSARLKRLKESLRKGRDRPSPMMYEWFDLLSEAIERGEPLPEFVFWPGSYNVFGTSYQIEILQHIDTFAAPNERCILYRAVMASPGQFSFTGIAEIIRELREFVKDWSYRNKQEKRRGELDLQRQELELSMAQTQYIEKYLSSSNEPDDTNRNPALITEVAEGLQSLEDLQSRGKVIKMDNKLPTPPKEK